MGRGQLSPKWIEALVKNLNSQPEAFRLLKDFVESWINARYRLEHWPHRDHFKEIARNLHPGLRQPESSPVRLDSGASFLELYTLLFGDPKESVAEWSDRQGAELLFLDLITSPFYDKIAKCERCQRFIFKTRADKVYCSQTCISAVPALKAHREQRRKERQANIASIRQAAEKFSKLSAERRAQLNQRDWIHNETGLSKKLVTVILRKVQQGG